MVENPSAWRVARKCVGRTEPGYFLLDNGSDLPAWGGVGREEDLKEFRQICFQCITKVKIVQQILTLFFTGFP